jgi:hypothetical protein
VATVTLCCKTSLIRGVSSKLIRENSFLNLMDDGLSQSPVTV